MDISPAHLRRLIDRLERRTNGCLEFMGARQQTGYGKIGVNGRTMVAHRLAYEAFVGPIPEGKNVLHRCDNPPCCEPSHLFVGTQAENLQDCRDKGRRPPSYNAGESHPKSKMTVDEVRAIRERYDAGEALRHIAADFPHVRKTNVLSIAKRLTWRHVS